MSFLTSLHHILGPVLSFWIFYASRNMELLGIWEIQMPSTLCPRWGWLQWEETWVQDIPFPPVPATENQPLPLSSPLVSTLQTLTLSLVCAIPNQNYSFHKRSHSLSFRTSPNNAKWDISSLYKQEVLRSQVHFWQKLPRHNF